MLGAKWCQAHKQQVLASPAIKHACKCLQAYIQPAYTCLQAIIPVYLQACGVDHHSRHADAGEPNPHDQRHGTHLAVIRAMSDFFLRPTSSRSRAVPNLPKNGSWKKSPRVSISCMMES
jgi:hypothetical protein